ncbi:hypothetical protein E2P81_ATG08122 [Venturia nashicola]|uniref:Uncharacterized protein n=1 Tax=Venturia nashicola TaxID=86259 RepID=A0A4Z1P6G8_9PEZI|nr:hypothetical protein E6O75_ATG08295 [Venturia nashicola]TLD26310.1 hypothetical protein E2P81_ATG08122 [Venturia nashicola]
MAQFVPRIRPDLIARRRPAWRAPVCVHEARRCFTIHHRKQAAKPGVGEKMVVQPPKGQNSQQSVRLQMKKAMKGLKDASKIPDDMGLLPDTFIMPTGEKLPSLFSEPKFRLQLEWKRAKRRVQDLLSAYIAYKFQLYSSMPMKNRPATPQINIRTIKPAALRLHKQMYSAYANGDTNVLQDICAEGVRDIYLSKIEMRNRNSDAMKWELVSYEDKTKLCSMKAGGMPVELKNIPIGLQQAVVRIKSLQRLTPGTKMGARAKRTKGDEKENIVWKEPKEKVVTEYFVIQRRLLEGVYEPWKAWGFVKEMDVAVERRIHEAENEILSRGNVSTPR